MRSSMFQLDKLIPFLLLMAAVARAAHTVRGGNRPYVIG